MPLLGAGVGLMPTAALVQPAKVKLETSKSVSMLRMRRNSRREVIPLLQRERTVANPVRLRSLFAEADPLVGFVLLVVAFEEMHG